MRVVLPFGGQRTPETRFDPDVTGDQFPRDGSGYYMFEFSVDFPDYSYPIAVRDNDLDNLNFKQEGENELRYKIFAETGTQLQIDLLSLSPTEIT